MNKIIVAAVTSALLAGCSQTGSQPGPVQAAAKPAPAPMLTSGFDPNLSPEAYTALCTATLEKAKADFARVEADTSKATLDSVMGAYDAMLNGLQNVQQSWYIKAIHPSAELRDAATQCSEKVSDLFSGFGMSRKFYERVAAIDLSSASVSEKFMIKNSLEDFKRSGVDKDEATRERIRALRQEISKIGNAFNKNIQEDVRYVETTVEGLKGLPEDYIENHPADENGVVRISTDYPDIRPVMSYGENDELRHKLRVASRSRGYPKNEPILKQLIEKRHELAQLLGYKNWAELSMQPMMIGTPEKAQSFLTAVGEALHEPVKKEQAVALARLQKIMPEAERVNVWQAGYINNKLRKEEYALDSKEVRKYFSYSNVRDGIFKLTEDLFGVEIKPWETATWHEDVESYEMRENGKLLGRFYMDNHPRENKYKHAAHWTLRSGLKGKQIPLSGLAQNFPKGLMEHGQVETFLHEFGHLLHNMFSGNQKWHGITGMSMERDFVEAPSQMLEEWVWDYDTLKSFAKNEAGEVIPIELVEKMNRARNFGQATATATQIYYANLSLNYYSRDPASFELMPLMREISDKFNPYPFVEGTAFFANFGHLNGYSSNYYTYQWSLAIATDMFSKFQEGGMRNTELSKSYRDRVLGAAGSKPASEFVADFLGREFSPDAYIQKLASGE